MITVDKKSVFFTAWVIFLCTIIFTSASFVSHELEFFLANDSLFAPEGEFAAILPRAAIKPLADDTLIFLQPNETFAKQDEFIRTKKDFMFVDLARMSLSLFRRGEIIKTFPIDAKGAEGSFFEVPSGLYNLRNKEKKHYSLIDNVWMPWSMHLFGNYVIHGRPQYASNKPVDVMFSGGCIRLATQDAQELFALSRIGMPILVASTGITIPVQASYFQKVFPLAEQPKILHTIPRVSASSVLAADFETGQILFQKNSEQVHPIASITKLMTAIIAIEKIDPFKNLIVDTQAENTFGNTGKLAIGEEFRAKDLLYPLILESSNDAATLYAQQVDGFVDMMNKKAADIGLAHTHFFEPTGLMPNNVSTAQDIFNLLSYVSIHNQPLFVLSSLPEYAFATKKRAHIWKNTTWPDNTGDMFIGGKSGFTDEANQTLAAVFRIKLSEEQDRPIAIILLGSRDRKRDAKLIMEYLQNNIVFGATLVRKKDDIPPILINTEANVFQSLRGLDIKIP